MAGMMDTTSHTLSFLFLVLSLVLSPFVTTVLATPEAGVVRINRCSYPGYYVAVPGVPDGPFEYQSGAIELPAHDWQYTPYIQTLEGGVSEKYASDYFPWLSNDIPIMQFEYGVGHGTTDRIWADLSFIDCKNGHCVFREGGYLVKWPGTQCEYIYCKHADDKALCEFGYDKPNDDRYERAEWACVHGNDFVNTVNTTIIFCPNDEDMYSVEGNRVR